MEWIKAESSPPKPRLSPKPFHYWNSPIYISFKLLGKGQITIGKVNSLKTFDRKGFVPYGSSMKFLGKFSHLA